MTTDPFAHPTYLLRRKVFRLFGGAFHILDPEGRVVLFSRLKAFRLKEDVRLYSDQTMASELLTIQARQVIDFSAAYDIVDTQSGERVGVLRRRGLKSMLRDEWVILNADDSEIGCIREDSVGLALIRRFVMNLVPQTFRVELGGHLVATYRQRFNPFVQKIEIDFTPDDRQRFDRRLGLAAAVLLCAVEGRQN